ncbi:hypothetical protein ACWT_5675 [Actinoplanes sp. SE50]|uniref:hypothetical protein n=1 Tax=unclassified Actinoplanes TaxID=2626549 RepID=UPI00023ED2CA|nr:MULTISPECIES: hypothetical protein [unclassified Actinoplanes]AEV86692.1 hypothetical protein ACPL_5805 [Actinoplanes sp. SE50/110]ATO85090.1 hypothetical protein ACWT_5675 [Actinoplanes sp. SE50]SLM02501.1 hypothetical protein ACSP50_5751 [Actinoplanes sp. SE50/110]
MTMPDTRSMTGRLFDALAENQRLRAFVEQVALLDDPEAEPFGKRIVSAVSLAAAARKVLR